jgi:hypothetical protein
MIKHEAKKDNFSMVFGTEQAARDYAAQHEGHEYACVREWRYWNDQARGENRYLTIAGDSLIAAIENNFDQINKNSGIYGASGCHLVAVTLEKADDNKAFLKIKAYPFSTGVVGFNRDERYIFNAENLREKAIEICDVTDDEFTGFYEFELNKN